MSGIIDSTNNLIRSLASLLENRSESNISIINDKLTLSVFSQLRSNIHNIKQINLVLRDPAYLPRGKEVSREFEIQNTANNVLFGEYDLVEKNKLGHFDTARAMHDFIDKHVNVRRVVRDNIIRSNLLMCDDDFAIFGDSSLEIDGKARRNSFSGISMNVELTDRNQIDRFRKNFELLWNNPTYTSNFKAELLQGLSYIYKEYAPEFLYYFTLNALFGSLLTEEGVKRFENEKTGFYGTAIWNSLFDFQRDGVVSAVRKLEKYNGCVIADSVGLGKTFEALAVIKYYELRNARVLVLTPVKLFDNWDSFRGNYHDNRFSSDRFAYDIVCHTDLSRNEGITRSGLNLSRINWGNYDLVVIDESHNFRNRIMLDDHQTRYAKLLMDIIQRGIKTKVLMLSATPVNNSLTDLRNQISIITQDNDAAFAEEGIPGVAALLRNAQAAINAWMEMPGRSKHVLLDGLPSEFFKLLDMVTIARSRKHITQYYNTKAIGRFPDKLKPETYSPQIDTNGELLSFEDTNELIERLKLAIYSPMSYLKPEYKEYYTHKYGTYRGERMLFFHEQREQSVATLHRFNLFKRLESSVFAFGETLRRMILRIESTISSLEKDESSPVTFDESEDDEDFLPEYKYEIDIRHLMRSDFLRDLCYDLNILQSVLADVDELLSSRRDKKIDTLQELLARKIDITPYNPGNCKVLIFTAFADTANYLYDKLTVIFGKSSVQLAVVTGSSHPKTTLPSLKCEFNTILRAFSPLSKIGSALPKEQQIDILIATDCLSEGQNLQDCDCVVNYDIQWNPVALVQRFGRIDRIGSKNERIAMVNFFPAMELNDYLQLEKRVRRKMVGVNLAGTGHDDFLNSDMNDFGFRQAQLERLKEEVIDIDELDNNLSLTDLNMNDYLSDLSQYIKNNPEINKVPTGIYSVTGNGQKGALFCFRHSGIEGKAKSDSSLYPYYLVFINEEGKVQENLAGARDTLKLFRALACGKNSAEAQQVSEFNRRTKNASDMSFYSGLLNQTINSIQGSENKNAQSSIFDFGGYSNAFAGSSSDDFELISLLVVN